MKRLAKIVESRAGEATAGRKGERYLIVEVNGQRYRVNVFRGRRVRLGWGGIGCYGFQWLANVQRVADGKRLYDKKIEKRTLSVDTILVRAGVIVPPAASTDAAVTLEEEIVK